jgi:hypothetical protein
MFLLVWAWRHTGVTKIIAVLQRKARIKILGKDKRELASNLMAGSRVID